MSVLLATGWSGSWPYLPEMIEELSARNYHADVFDVEDLGQASLPVRIKMRFPIVRSQARLSALKQRLQKLPTNYQAVNIHYVLPIYSSLLDSLSLRGNRLISSIWGSDFLRADREALLSLRRTLVASDFITTNNPEVENKLIQSFPEIGDRIRVLSFGMRVLDVIKKLRASESLEQSRYQLGIPMGKTVVVIGYNGIPQQQHHFMIEGLEALTQSEKDKLYVIAPMTYPQNHEYQSDVEARLSRIGIEYEVIRDFQSIENTSRLRIVTDVVINVQITDSLSGSIQEHLMAGSRLIVGEWLPYDLFNNMGAPITTVDCPQAITAALQSKIYKKSASSGPCSRAIYERASWGSCINQWIDLFEGTSV